MKIRLYRGPLDGKVMHTDRVSNQLIIHYTPKYKKGSDKWFEQQQGYARYMTTGPHNEVEIPRYMQTVYYRTRYQHPDGSVFYEWENSKNRKDKVNPLTYPSSYDSLARPWTISQRKCLLH